MVHSLFSIVAPIVGSGAVKIREAELAFDSLGMVHFASVVVFDEPAGAKKGQFPRHVVFESAIDGTVDDYLAALVFEPVRRGALADLFASCEGFDDAVNRHHSDSEAYRAALAAYLKEHLQWPELFHIGNPGLRVDQITAGAALRCALDDVVKKSLPSGLSHESPLEIAARLRKELQVPESAKTHWHLDPRSAKTGKYAWFSDPVSLWGSRLLNWGKLIVIGLGFLLGLGFLIYRLWAWGGFRWILAVSAGVAVASWIFWKWLQGKHRPTDVDARQLRAQTEQEDHGVHNHMSSLALLKPGFLRQVSIRAVLRVLNLVYRTWFTDITPGKLAGLPTIHFAQWTIVRLPNAVDGQRREALMFLSNYDGSWESYLDDFLEFLFQGVVAIWGNAVTFPSPLDGRIFKHWARTRMSPHALWHDKVYPELTVSNIQNNNRLRLGLFKPPRTDNAARLWLARLGAIQRGDEHFDDVAGPLPTHDMQGLVLRGYGTLPYAAYALLRLDHGEAARHWLQSLVPSITDGRELDKRDRAREVEAVNVAFTHRALEVLEVPVPVRERFPLVFQEGIAPTIGTSQNLQHRSRILGDVGDSAPENWAWGERVGEKGRADVLLLMYARSATARNALQKRQLDAFRASGAGEQIDVVCSDPLADDAPDGKTLEHFGFVDGLSQPVIEGTWQAGRDNEKRSAADLMKPGEFVLGYQSGDGSTTPGVPIEAAFDPDKLLPPVSGPGDLRDLGRNGTFLVARQLSQDVAAFRRFTTEAAGVAASQYGTRAAEAVAAQVVGRWRSGTPLVDIATSGDLNSFSFGSDPHGFRCPIGAHIRRANPRDSLGVDGALAQASANRHRLLRRGRPYGPPLPPGQLEDDRVGRGLMFVCLSADIERQFEFVQQNWINSPTFGGLYAERDPLIGAISPPAHLTIQANAICQRIEGLSRFVGVIGGGYFFMPGMSALRYLARLEPRKLPQLATTARVPPIAPPHRSPLRSAFAVLAAALPFIGLVWAIRFPLLLAALLVLLPFSAAWIPAMALPLFLTTAAGAALIAFLASTAAWAAMVMLRLVLMYGTRVGLKRPKWTTSAKWWHVFAFQALALPIVIASLHYTARDLSSAGAGSYRQVAIRLALAAGGGLALGVLALGVATAIQSLRPGSRPDLFAPPFPVLTRIVRRLSRARMVHRAVRGVSSLSESIVGSVPEAIGVGYIDYRNRRLLPGHAFAAVLASLVFLVYVAGFFFLNPSRREGYPEVPAVAYVLFMLIALGWLLSAASFFLDRYRIPTLLTIAAWFIAVASFARTDHIFEVGGPIEPAASPAEIVTAAQTRGPFVVVASEGYALASSAWTAEVLTRLAAEGEGRRFTDAVRLISASSGATLGTTHFVNAYTDNGFDAASLEAIRRRARAPSSAEGWWGLIYPDLIRGFVPVLVPSRADRGWAIEAAWRRAFPDGHGPTLSEWRRDVAKGWRPATVFGVTSAETGEQGLLASYRVRDVNQRGPDFVTLNRDVRVITAARLSAGFPYVSPIPRPGTDDPLAFHFTDGGFWDNTGVLPALQFIEDAGPDVGKVLLIEVRSSPERRTNPPESRPWTLEAFGPLRTLVQVRYNGHAARTEDALQQFMRLHPVERVIFDLKDSRVPFTWNMGQTHSRYFEEAWKRGDNQAARDKVLAFLKSQ